MAALRKIVYQMGKNNNAPVTVNAIRGWFDYADSRHVIYSFLKKYWMLFRRQKVLGQKRRYNFFLSKQGLKYFHRLQLKYNYDLDEMNGAISNDFLNLWDEIEKIAKSDYLDELVKTDLYIELMRKRH